MTAIGYGGGYLVEIIAVRNAASMCAGYEYARLKSDAKYKVYMHQDVVILRKDLIGQLLRQFQRAPWVGMIGLAGCKCLPPNGVWWESHRLYNRVFTLNGRGELKRFVYDDSRPDTAVDAIDGLFMATQCDVPWRADVFRGWHFYDVSQCMEYRRRGYKLALAGKSGEGWAIHLAGSTTTGTPEYQRWQAVFLREYANEMAAQTKT